jgi:hypothetical protein
MGKLRRAFLLTNAPSHGSLLRLSKYRAFQQEAGENSKGIPQAGKIRVVGKKDVNFSTSEATIPCK